MKKRLRLLSWVLSLAMLCQVLPIAAFAESDVGESLAAKVATVLEEENGTSIATGKCGDNLTWSLSGDWVLTISGSGAMDDYSWDYYAYSPAPWNNNYCDYIKTIKIASGVTSIGNCAFHDCSALKSVTISDSVTSIGDSAFSDCSNLESITIPNNVISLGNFAFTFTNLESVIIPDSVTSIGYSAFYHCTNLKSITIPNSVTSMGNTMFYYCPNLEFITLPEGITSIGSNTFSFCSSLKFITIPYSVTSIGDSAFSDCSSLQDIYYTGTQKQWDSISIDPRNSGALQTATIHYLSTGPEEKNEFTFGRDNLSFLNKSGDFFSFADRANNVLSKLALVNPRPLNPSQKNQIIYNISDEKFDQLTTKLTPTLKKRFLDARLSEWGGSCRGMSTVVMLHYLYPDMLPLSQLPTISESTPYELPSPKDNDDVSNLINYYQLAQFLPTYQLKKRETLVNSLLDFSGTLSDLIDSLENGTPVLVGMQSNRGGHAVVFLKIISEDDNEYKISIYDPNYSTAQTLKLLKTPYVPASEEGPEGFLHVQYGTFNYIQCYIKASDLEHIDIRNYFGLSDNESYIDYDMPSISISPNSNIIFTSGDKTYYRTKNGETVYSDSSIISFFDEYADETGSSNLNICIPSALSTSPIQLDIAPLNGTSDTNILLNNTLLSISTSGPVELTYNEAARTVDVTAEDPTDVNLLFTQNTTDEAWPWNSWAIDTTGTTSFHAELDDSGLHLTGDGISEAKVATENSNTDAVDTIILPKKSDNDDSMTVTISNKKDSSDNDELVIDGSGSTTTDPKPNPGDTDKDPTPTPKPGDSTTAGSSTTQSSGSASSGGDDGGAGGLLLVGAGAAAAAITAGVVLSMPVEVQGRVEHADHTPLANAKVSILQNGNVVAQTTADESGAFIVKVKRGSYELTAAYTDENGQLIHQTIPLKVPVKDLTITF